MQACSSLTFNPAEMVPNQPIIQSKSHSWVPSCQCPLLQPFIPLLHTSEGFFSGPVHRFFSIAKSGVRKSKLGVGLMMHVRGIDFHPRWGVQDQRDEARLFQSGLNCYSFPCPLPLKAYFNIQRRIQQPRHFSLKHFYLFPPISLKSVFHFPFLR